MSTRWWRKSCMQARRCSLRLQSRHNRGAEPRLLWMHQHADPTRLFRVPAVPLTLLTQSTGTTVSNPGGVEHPQGAVGFATLFGRVQRLASRAAQGAISLRSPRRALRSARLSRASQPREKCSQRRKPRAQTPLEWLEQTRSCAWEKAQADGPAPGASFQTHCETICHHSCPQEA